jgi:phasin family protein
VHHYRLRHFFNIQTGALFMLTPEQLLTAQKANIETLLGLSGKAFEGVEKLVELNLQTAKAALGEAASTTQAALSVKNPQEWVALQTATLQPIADKAAAYGRQVYDIAASTGAEVAKVVEATATDAQKKILAVVDTAVKNAPAGTENAVSFVKSAVAAANDAYESLQKVAKQATDAAEANLSAFSATTTKAAPASRSKRAA